MPFQILEAVGNLEIDNPISDRKYNKIMSIIGSDFDTDPTSDENLLVLVLRDSENHGDEEYETKEEMEDYYHNLVSCIHDVTPIHYGDMAVCVRVIDLKNAKVEEKVFHYEFFENMDGKISMREMK